VFTTTVAFFIWGKNVNGGYLKVDVKKLFACSSFHLGFNLPKEL